MRGQGYNVGILRRWIILLAKFGGKQKIEDQLFILGLI